MPTATAEPAEIEIKKEVADIVARAEAFTITTQEDATAAAAVLQEIKSRINRVVDYWKEPKSLAQKAHKNLCAKEKELLDPLEQADRIVRNKTSDFLQEQERARQAELRRIQDAAEAAERERRRIEAEELRKANEAAAAAAAVRAEELRKANEAAAVASRARAAELKRAGDAKAADALRLETIRKQQQADEEAAALAALEAENQARAAEEAAELLAAPVMVAIEAPAAAPKLAGVSSTKVYKFEIIDAQKIPREYLVPDTAAIGKVVKAMKDRIQIPGVRIYTEQQIGVR